MRLLALVVVATTVALAVPPAASAVDFAGQWKLNRSLSDKPSLKVIEAFGEEATATPGASGGATGLEDQKKGRSEEVRILSRLPDELTLSHADSAIVVAYTDDRTRVYVPDGSEKKSQALGGEVIVCTAFWEGDKLVIDSSSSHGLKTRETYDLSRGPGRLTVTVRLESQRMTKVVTLTRVYDRLSRDAKPRDPDDAAPDPEETDK